MSKHRNRAEQQAELDESYETEFFEYRVGRHFPLRIRNLIPMAIVIAIVSGIFQYNWGEAFGTGILVLAFEFGWYGWRQGRWNRNVKRYGLEAFRAQFDVLYKKDGKD